MSLTNIENNLKFDEFFCEKHEKINVKFCCFHPECIEN